MSQEETIDLQKLTTKELLIQVLGKVDAMSKDIDKIQTAEVDKAKEQTNLLIEFAKLETKVKVWGIASGIIAALIIEIIVTLIQ